MKASDALDAIPLSSFILMSNFSPHYPEPECLVAIGHQRAIKTLQSSVASILTSFRNTAETGLQLTFQVSFTTKTVMLEVESYSTFWEK